MGHVPGRCDNSLHHLVGPPIPLGEILKELWKAGLMVNPKKCHLGLTTAWYPGYCIMCGLLKPQEKKIDAVKGYRQPMTKKQVCTSLGLAGYYCRFMPNFSSLAFPLSDLTKKGQLDQVQWKPETQEEFQALKQALAIAPVLRNPNFDCPFIVHTDTSETGLGCCPFTDLWRRRAPGPVHQQEAAFSREKVCHSGKRSPCNKVSHQGAVLVPGRPALHPSHQPCSSALDGQGKEKPIPGTLIGPFIAGLLVPGSTPSRSPTQKCQWAITPVGPTPSDRQT